MFINATRLADPVPSWESLALFASKGEAADAAEAVGWSRENVARAKGRFQILWGIYNAGQGYMTQGGYDSLLAARTAK